MLKVYENISIKGESSILSAMKQMDKVMRKLLIVISDEKYVGLISIGDIQRAIIRNNPLTESVLSIMRDDYIVSKPGQSKDEIRKLMLKLRAEFMPVVDDKSNLVEVFFWNDLFDDETKKPLNKFDLPVVIMAGGQGTRLKPLTNVIPKPLIPIDEKTIIEHIFDKFAQFGCNKFYISVNYKADLIEYYLNEMKLPFSIDYFREHKPLGTAGSLSLLKGKINETFFVTNCDILIEQDYSEILKYHNENNNAITIVAAIKTIPISYGTLETGENGQLIALAEKPELTFKINSGMYILEPHLLQNIPENSFFHITNLIDWVVASGGKVGVFPVSEKSWTDIGEWAEYLHLISKSNFEQKV